MRDTSSVFLIFLALLGLLGFSHAQLKVGFYDQSCPEAESIVQEFVKQHIPNAPTLAAPLLRMQFHDCFVRGCDGSVLLNATGNNTAEKDAIPNQTLRGFDFIDRVKALLEAKCPGVVSCADIISLVARDAVVVTGGPSWTVPTGRRDGTISSSTEALNNIPQPTMNFTTLTQSFANKSLDVKDLVVLSGSHTIGIGHCQFVTNRLYNFTGKGDQDPSMDPFYLANLKQFKCKTPTDNTTILEMDPGSFRTFDKHYYTNLVKRRGLFTSDASLLTDSTALSYVNEILNGPLENFYSEFAASMLKMIQVEVKTGTAGEIRKVCSKVNS
ncbi:peroxidase 3-like [Nymphaea colorata]|nr:peroxidase 3-like [Nymphaea colorata]